ncbi:bucentaur or craniofacial development-domain-containing protein [Lenzites betulinus]|nr:bucentaur or craniofacial development-domain-containing protein [Lenzites betulinus]
MRRQILRCFLPLPATTIATLLCAMDSDSDNDSDYVPPKDAGSDTEAPAPKRARTDAPPVTESSEDTVHKQQGDEAYAAFKASLSAPPPTITTPDAGTPQTVKIVRRFRFAGEEVAEVKEVPADSREAKEWPLWKPREDNSSKGQEHTDRPPASHSGSATAVASSSSATPASSSAKPPGKRPGPRKPKTTLAPIPKKDSVKKLTTLDKSAMDWRAHVEGDAPPDVKDELEANRRGGGYLEKVEFLQRVEARKEEVLDANKGKRRR